MKHIHAELMLQYAQDAMETDKPWERWEVRHFTDGEWKTMTFPVGWEPEFSYRRKRKLIDINGYEVPEPVRDKLTPGTIYYILDLGYDRLFIECEWLDYAIDNKRLNKGLIHLTKEAAINHAEALLSFTRIDE